MGVCNGKMVWRLKKSHNDFFSSQNFKYWIHKLNHKWLFLISWKLLNALELSVLNEYYIRLENLFCQEVNRKTVIYRDAQWVQKCKPHFFLRIIL